MASIIRLPVPHRESVIEPCNADGFLLPVDVQHSLQRIIDDLPGDSATVHHYDEGNATLISLRVDYGQVCHWSMHGPCSRAQADRFASDFDRKIAPSGENDAA